MDLRGTHSPCAATSLTAANGTGLQLLNGGTVDNAGTIEGPRHGIFVTSAGFITNHGVITGGTAIAAAAAATVVNHGTVITSA